jgi:hypothetical protein
MRFTMGQGTTGLEREAYYVGEVVLGRLLKIGHTEAPLGSWWTVTARRRT